MNFKYVCRSKLLHFSALYIILVEIDIKDLRFEKLHDIFEFVKLYSALRRVEFKC